MALLSAVTYNADGVTDTFNIPFDYLKPEHIKVTVNGTSATFTFNSESVLKMDAVPANGDEVRVYRVTPKDVREVVFKNPSIQDASDFNLNSDQLFFIMQEAVSELDLNKLELETLVADTEDAIRADLEANDQEIADLEDRMDTTEDNTSANTTQIGNLATTVSDHSAQLAALTGDPLEPVSGGAGSVVVAPENPDPAKYAEANAQTLSRLAFPDLFQSLGNNYRVIDPVTPLTQETAGTTGLPDPGTFNSYSIARLTNDRLLMTNSNQLFMSDDNGDTWSEAIAFQNEFETINPIPVGNFKTGLAVNGDKACTRGRFGGTTSQQDDHILYTVDGGDTWAEATTPQYFSNPDLTVSETVKAIFPFRNGFLICGINSLINYTEDFQTFTTLNRVRMVLGSEPDAVFDYAIEINGMLVVGYEDTSAPLLLEVDLESGSYFIKDLPTVSYNRTRAIFDYNKYLGRLEGLEASDSVNGTGYYVLTSMAQNHELKREIKGESPNDSMDGLEYHWLSGTAVIASYESFPKIYPQGFDPDGGLAIPYSLSGVSGMYTDGEYVFLTGAPGYEKLSINYDPDLFHVPYIEVPGSFKAYIKLSN